MAVIEVAGLHKRYGDVVAVEDVSFSVEEGEIFGVLGPNGAGKTTTVECVEGLRTPDRGSVRVLGRDPRRDRDELRRLVGAQLQGSELPDKLRVGEAVELYRSFYREPADGDALLAALGLAEQRRTRYRRLSGGQKQRLSIALALIGRPRLAILDELTTGLDPKARRDVWSLIRRVRDQGVTILLVTHFMDEAERLCDRVALIDAGTVAAIDTPARLADRFPGEQVVRFEPSSRIAEGLLVGLPGVTEVRRDGDVVRVTGSGDLATVVVAALARVGVTALRLRVERGGLEDAFLALTEHHADPVGRPRPDALSDKQEI
jgi:ABC-2 type transport system ATP-binding protein